MVGSLPKEYWIIVGDFNMIDFWDNECGVVKNTWKGNEYFFWNKFKRRLNLIDPVGNKKSFVPDGYKDH